MLSRVTDTVVESMAEDIMIGPLDNASLALVTSGPIGNSAATAGQFVTWGTPVAIAWGGPFVDVNGNYFLSAPGAEFPNAGTLNVAVIGAIGTTGPSTALALKFQFQFENPVNIPPLGNLSVPVKIIIPLTESTVPEPTF